MPPYIVPTELPLFSPVRQVLQRLANRPSTSQQLAERARTILEMSEGGSNNQVAARLDLHPTSVRKWRNRWLQAEPTFEAVLEDEKALTARVIEALGDEPRPGKPTTFTPEQVAAIIALACEPPEAAGIPVSHWSYITLAEEAVRRGLVEAISPATVGRFLKSGRVEAPQSASLAHRRAR